jgi:hypothetical protein
MLQSLCLYDERYEEHGVQKRSDKPDAKSGEECRCKQLAEGSGAVQWQGKFILCRAS